jgi:hypothetical protein
MLPIKLSFEIKITKISLNICSKIEINRKVLESSKKLVTLFALFKLYLLEVKI